MALPEAHSNSFKAAGHCPLRGVGRQRHDRGVLSVKSHDLTIDLEVKNSKTDSCVHLLSSTSADGAHKV